ncbi:carbonic anhydrase 2-like isoform X1 [Tachypleus tridentatus]|uniref:carbonic anhydrase 2-like isoform X1 n=1 Tax=Tachypleus tridentatus TaxID=6853 RepID=UPI003FD37A75
MLAVLLLLSHGTSFGFTWSYHGVKDLEYWPETCNGNKQSPVNIEKNKVQTNNSLGSITFVNYDKPLYKPLLVNNGHSVQLNIEEDENVPMIKNGGLEGNYKFQQLHFHWGNEDSMGSEHTVDDKTYCMEMHLVHYNSKYRSDEAIKYPDGLAVVAVLFIVENNIKSHFSSFTDILKNIRHEGNSTVVSSVDLTLKSLLPQETTPFYRYSGSLTTPPCSEVILWTVLANPVKIGKTEIEEFRRQKTGEGQNERSLVNNFRTPRKLNQRLVQLSGNLGSQFMSDSLCVYVSFVLVISTYKSGHM